MMRRSKGEYQSAVAVARAAISNRRSKSPVRADRSPEALLAEMQERQANGEALTNAHFEALQAAMSRQNGKHRGRGRPKGTRDKAAGAAFYAAAVAVEHSGLDAYRNVCAPHRSSQCDAIAEAMQAEGFRTLATYDAVVSEMKVFRRTKRKQAPGLAHFRSSAECLASLSLLGRTLQENSQLSNETIAAFSSLIRPNAGTSLAFREHIASFSLLGRTLQENSRLSNERIAALSGLIRREVDAAKMNALAERMFGISLRSQKR